MFYNTYIATLACDYTQKDIDAYKQIRKEFAKRENALSLEINVLQKDYKNNIENLKLLREERSDIQKYLKAFTLVTNFLEGINTKYIPNELENYVFYAICQLEKVYRL